jgi:hypothetical protein
MASTTILRLAVTWLAWALTLTLSVVYLVGGLEVALPAWLDALRNLWQALAAEGKDSTPANWYQAAIVVGLTALAFLAHYARRDSDRRIEPGAPQISPPQYHVPDGPAGTPGPAASCAEPPAAPPDGDGLVHGTAAAWQEDDEPSLGSRLKSWIPIIWFFVLPAFVYFGATVQHHTHDAAVFVMAIAAIYVAGEHFTSLGEQMERLQTVRMEQDAQVRGLNTSLQQQMLQLQTVRTELGTQVKSIENALGTFEGQKELYKQYATPLAAESKTDRSVYAIYRHFDIDKAWWDARTWNDFIGYEFDNIPTLVGAIRKGRRDVVRIVAPLEYPLHDNATVSSVDAANRFHNFMGLIWHWLALYKLKHGSKDSVAKHMPHLDYAIVITEVSHWVHVVNGNVYQIIGDYPDHLKVRNLTLELTEMSRRLEKWEREEILKLAERGQDAADFICSALTAAILSQRSITYPNFNLILDSLGCRHWMNRASSYGIPREPEFMREHFRNLLEEFTATMNAVDGTASGTFTTLSRKVQ